ncbi:MAG: hypothetical protein ACD_2C00027G0006 [uncultured bacterium (gcode 4)]|uniref:Ankyrin repeat protein n=1 Tax=uncultured bacterium (gcode 4) TaxID=1234023 RepID=K2G4N2_9BACT|nr:MAG: hypothetical protein ACD_2C00027G0006 [uncultured bacterium (gcode 4)]
MTKENLDDITRLLSLDFDELAWVLGHSPGEAKAIVDSAVTSSLAVCGLVDDVSGNVDDVMASISYKSDYRKEELILIAAPLLSLLEENVNFSWVDKIHESENLFCTDENGNDILMAMLIGWNVDAIEYLIKFPFYFNHKNKEGKTIVDILYSLKNNPWSILNSVKVGMCADMIAEKLESEPTFEFIEFLISGSQYSWAYSDILAGVRKSWNMNETVAWNTLLITASMYWEYRLVKALVNYWCDIGYVGNWWKTALELAQKMAESRPDTEWYRDIVNLLTIMSNPWASEAIMDYLIEFAASCGATPNPYAHFMGLLSKSVNINVVDTNTWNTLLNTAILNWNEPLMKLLLKNWARTDIKNMAWLDCKELAKLKWNVFYQNFMVVLGDVKREEEKFNKALDFLSSSADSGIIDQLTFIRHSKDLNARNWSWDAILHILAKKWDLNSFETIFKLWGDIYMRDNKLNSMFDCAREWKNIKLLEFIEQNYIPF